jgi:hypothetical protein
LDFRSNGVVAHTTIGRNDGLSVRPIIAIITGHEYVDMGDGLKWATCNLDAENPWDVGGYFAWGEIAPKDSFDENNYRFGRYMTKYNDFDDLFRLELSDDAAQQMWGGTWRMPTKEEYEALADSDKYELVWTDDYKKDGTNYSGLIVKRKNGPCAGNSFFLPISGKMSGDTIVKGSNGFYWTSTRAAHYSGGRVLNIQELYSHSGIEMFTESRYLGCPIRAVSE